MKEKVMKCILLLSILSNKEISVKEAISLLELITKSPEIIKKSLKIAEKKGLIKREKGKLILKFEKKRENFHKPKITRQKCSSNCKRCGRRITNCFFLEFHGFSLGPFGSECVRKLKIQYNNI